MQPRLSHFVFKGARYLSVSPLAGPKVDVVKCNLWDFQVLFRVIAVFTYRRIGLGYYY